ncbi:MAG: glycosyltransferase [Trichodesmium sp. MAG_R04]|nr:glycosyltransferase [Trichodesmium sp. MAG_R04]
MNRNSNLAQALPSWLKAPEIGEIIVLDWSSKDPVKNIIDRYEDERITLARVENQDRWIAARAFNIAARLTTRTKMVKMDADTKISPDFFRVHQLKPGTFITGNWRKARNENEKHLYGITYVYREDFFQINGFNEQLTLYGWADSDLFERLESIGLKQLDFNLDTLDHIKHENRIKNQKHSFRKNVRDDVIAGLGIQRNRYICKNLPPWDKSFDMIAFEVKEIDKNRLLCYQTDAEKYRIPDDLVGKAEEDALRNVLSFPIDGLGASIPAHYSQKFSHSTLLELNSLFNCIEKKTQASYSGFKLITTLYNETQIERALEYLNCLHRSYYHHLIDEIHVFYDTSKDQKTNLILNYLHKKKNITVKIISGRPTYKNIFDYANQCFTSGSRIIVSNADIYFNETLNLAVDIDLKEKFIVLTRWNQQENNNLLLQKSNGLPNYFSADVWIFQLPLKVDFHCNYQLGTPFCDSFLNNQLSKTNYRVYNPCLEIQACHLHKNWQLSKSKLVLVQNQDGNKEHQQEIVVKEWKREGRKDPNRGVVWCNLKDLYQEPCNMFKWRKHNIVLEIYMDKDRYERTLTCFSFLKIAENIDRNLWIIESSLHQNLIEFIKFLRNERFYLIKSYKQNQSDIVYYDDSIHSPLIPKNFDDDKSWYIRTSYLADIQNPWMNLQNLYEVLDRYQQFLKDSNYENVDQVVSIFKQKIKYKELVKSSWEFYKQNNVNACIEYLNKSLKYNNKSLCETISDWIEKFSYFSTVDNLPFDIWSFSETPSWKQLISSTIQCQKPLETSLDLDATRVSIITSVYNGDKYIEKFLEDITQQTVFHLCELILINPHSPGNEEPVIKNYLKQYPNIVYKKLDYDPGLYEVWNIGIKMARGEYITNANLDDRRSPVHIEKHLEALEDNPEVGLVCAALKVTKKENETWAKNTAHATWFNQGFPENIQTKHLFRKEQKTEKIVSQCIPHCMPVWRKSLHEEYGYFNEAEYGTSADWEFWLRCSSQGSMFKLIKEPLGLYLENVGSYMRTFSKREKMMNKIIKKYYREE